MIRRVTVNQNFLRSRGQGQIKLRFYPPLCTTEPYSYSTACKSIRGYRKKIPMPLLVGLFCQNKIRKTRRKKDGETGRERRRKRRSMRGMPSLQETLASIKLHSCRLHVRKWSHYGDSGHRRMLRIYLRWIVPAATSPRILPPKSAKVDARIKFRLCVTFSGKLDWKDSDKMFSA